MPPIEHYDILAPLLAVRTCICLRRIQSVTSRILPEILGVRVLPSVDGGLGVAIQSTSTSTMLEASPRDPWLASSLRAPLSLRC